MRLTQPIWTLTQQWVRIITWVIGSDILPLVYRIKKDKFQDLWQLRFWFWLWKFDFLVNQSHPELNKRERKDLCRTLDCRKLSLEACMHAAQNESLPLRVVVQVLFSEQARTAMVGGHKTTLPSNIKALLAANGTDTSPPESLSTVTSTPQPQNPRVSCSRMIVDANGESVDVCSKIKQHCLIPSLPKTTMFSKLWLTNHVENEK